MNSLKVPESGLLLEGPSNADVVSPPQAFILSLSDDIVAGLIQSARAGEDLHIALGSTPALHFGCHSHRITPPADDVPYDLYLTKPFESTRKAERLSHTSSLFKKPPVTASQKKKTARKATKESEKISNGVSANGKSSTPSALDSDIEALQNGLAAHDAARDRARMVGKPPASMKTQEKMKSTKLLASYNSASKSIPNSPALHNSAPSPSSAPTLSASQQVVERKKEQRVVLVHELAVKDRTTEYLREKWTAKEGDFRPTLEKTADFITESKKWAMKKSCWKELDVWKYDYEFQDERQMAIDNAIRQYDRQRLSSSEVEWQRLLPVEERGKGKCLSRLQANLAKGPTQPTPKIKVQRADDSSGSKDDGDDLDGEKPRPVAESMSRSQSNPLPVKSKKPSAQEAQFKRLLGNSKAKSVAPKVPSTKAKAAPKGASTTGRVLSAAIIENSDSSGDEAMGQKTRTTAPKPKDTVIVKTKPLQREPASKQHRLPASATVSASAPPPVRAPAKRIREDDDSSFSSGTPLSKRIKTKQPMAPPSTQLHRPLKTVPPVRSAGVSSAVKNKKTSPTKSSPLASSPPTNASELDEESPPAPVRKRKVESETKPVPVKRRVVESVPTEVLTKAHKFKTYYQKYEALHWEISGLDDPPSEKLADLLDMRGRLQSMKDEIYKQYSPDRG